CSSDLTGSSDSGSRATYAGSVDKDKGVLENVFLSDFRINPETKRSELVTVWAAEGRMVQHEGMNYLELLDGKQYQGQPGAGDFRNVTFERGLVRSEERRVGEECRCVMSSEQYKTYRKKREVDR